MNHEEVKKRLLTNPRVREAYENPPLHLAVARATVERRKELGMTQEELAKKMGSSQAQVWRIESGAFNPTSKTISKLEGALGVSLGASRRMPERVTDLPPIEQLDEWIETGLLLMSKEDLNVALELEQAKPGQLAKLVRIIEGIELDEGESIQVTVRVTEAEERGDPRSADAPQQRLELSATL